MKRWIKTSYDRLLLALAAVLATTSCLWTWYQQPGLRRLRAQPVNVRLSGLRYEQSNCSRADALPAVWLPPAAQSHGRGWLYEVFAAPAIYYDALARSFRVAEPLAQSGEDRPVGLELVRVKREPFRLQLVGYFGEPGDYRAAFASPDLPETLIARAGSRLAELGLTLTAFDVRRVVVAESDAGPVYEVAAIARVWDETVGAEVELDSRARKFTDRPLAVFRLPATKGRLCERSAGDTLSDGSTTYRVDRVQLEPPEVTVTREAPDSTQPEHTVLRPALNRTEVTASKSATARSMVGESTGLAAAGN